MCRNVVGCWLTLLFLMGALAWALLDGEEPYTIG